MKRIMGGGVLLLAALLAAGCVESTTLIDLERDGSGTITVREFFSPQVTQGMAGMAAMGGLAEDEAPKDFIGDLIKQRTTQLGEGVTLAGEERLTNERGWQGYRARFAFEDVRRLRIAPGSMDAEGAPDEDETLRITFEPGTPARLAVRFPDAPPDEEGEEAPEAPEAMDEMMMQMMRPMLQGMRIAALIRFPNAIEETNSRYVSEDRRTVTLMDVAMEQVLANPEAFRLLQSQSPDTPARLAEMNIEGVRLEAPGHTVDVRF